MFRKFKEALQNTDEDRAYLRERYAAIAEECGRWAYWETFVLEAPDMGVVRGLWRRLRLLWWWRRAERVARAGMERHGGSERR